MDPRPKFDPKAIIPSFLALAATAIFLVLPVFGSFVLMLLPAPVAYSRFVYGKAYGFATAAACLLFAGLATGSAAFPAVVLPLCLAGILMGASLSRGERADATLVKASLIPLAAAGLMAGAYFISAGIDPAALLKEAVARSAQESAAFYRQLGFSEADIKSMEPALAQVSGVAVDYFPAILVFSMVIIVSLCLSVTVGFLEKGGLLDASARAPLSQWHAPDHLVWGIIVPGFLMVPDVHALRVAAGNLLAIFAIAYLYQGLAVVSSLFERARISPIFRGIIYFFMLTQTFLIIGIWALGLFDTWADFRKIRPKDVSKNT